MFSNLFYESVFTVLILKLALKSTKTNCSKNYPKASWAPQSLQKWFAIEKVRKILDPRMSAGPCKGSANLKNIQAYKFISIHIYLGLTDNFFKIILISQVFKQLEYDFNIKTQLRGIKLYNIRIVSISYSPVESRAPHFIPICRVTLNLTQLIAAVQQAMLGTYC